MKIFRYMLLVFSVMLFGTSLVFNNSNVMVVSISVILLHNIIYSLEDFYNRITFLAFQCTFFTFLYGRIFFRFISNQGYGLNFDSNNTIKHILVSLFISLFFCFLGYLFKNKNDKEIREGKDNQYIKIASKYTFYFAFVFRMMVIFERVIFVKDTSYVDYYLSYSSSLPFMAIKFSEMMPIALFIYLACMPSKKECKIPIILYFVEGIGVLAYGQRNGIVLNVLVIIIYLCIRNSMCNVNEKWFGKKQIIITLILAPICIIFLYSFSFIRAGNSYQIESPMQTIVKFFDGQGNSVNIIGYGTEFQENFPKGKHYTFGGIVSFFKRNVITEMFLNIPTYKQHTEEMALYGDSYGQTISYLVDSWSYMKGKGLGSCYIAEVYHDYGYIGIILCNTIYGVILAVLGKGLRNKSWLTGAIALLMIKNILYAPRAEAVAFITSSINMINIATIIIIVIFARGVKTKIKGRNKINGQKEIGNIY